MHAAIATIDDFKLCIFIAIPFRRCGSAPGGHCNPHGLQCRTVHPVF